MKAALYRRYGGDRELEQIVAGYENVIAWLVGHSHANRVRAVAGADADHPGYWEIMTSAMADYPGQARVIELVDNGDGTLSILATLIDFDEESCAERRYRRLVEDTVEDKRAPELISAVLRHGALERGEAQMVLKTSERTARNTLSKLTAAGFLKSASPKTPVRLAFPLDYRERLFPNLFAYGDLPG